MFEHSVNVESSSAPKQMAMLNAFTDAGQLMVKRANEFAEFRHHDYVRSIHVIFGMFSSGCQIANIIQIFGGNLLSARGEVDLSVSEFETAGELLPAFVDMAIEISREQNHDVIDSAHFSSALLLDPEQVLAQILIRAGIEDSLIRLAIETRLEQLDRSVADEAMEPRDEDSKQVSNIRYQIREASRRRQNAINERNYALAIVHSQELRRTKSELADQLRRV